MDPNRTTWSKDLQNLLKPFKGELETYPVPKEVGKVGNNSETFIIPLASSQNKSNIANFFSKGATKGESKSTSSLTSRKMEKKEDSSAHIKREQAEDAPTIEHEVTNDDAPSATAKLEAKKGIKRELEDETDEKIPSKISKISASPSKYSFPSKAKTRSATSNSSTSPKKPTNKEKGSQKITSFFSK